MCVCVCVCVCVVLPMKQHNSKNFNKEIIFLVKQIHPLPQRYVCTVVPVKSRVRLT